MLTCSELPDATYTTWLYETPSLYVGTFSIKNGNTGIPLERISIEGLATCKEWIVVYTYGNESVTGGSTTAGLVIPSYGNRNSVTFDCSNHISVDAAHVGGTQAGNLNMFFATIIGVK